MKQALVTGASKGIGKEIALALLKQGFFVHATYNTGVEDSRNISSQNKNIKFYKCNFTQQNELDKLINKLLRFKFDCIVNNSGMIKFENFNDFNFQNWRDTFEVNLHAPLFISLKLQNNLNKNASIINIASLDGYVGSFASMAYSASKASLINLTKSLGNNFGSKYGVRVNAIAPGWIDTGMSTDESFAATSLTPLSRNGTPYEIADLVVFLASEKSSFINGSTIVIDGGYGNVDYIMLQESLKNE